MNITLLPFFSQQHRATGEFLTRTCGNVKQLAALARELLSRGHSVRAVVPTICADTPPWPADVELLQCWLPAENPLQRVHWDVEFLRTLLGDVDVLVTSHEYISIPARALYPQLKVALLCNVRPDSDLFSCAFDAATTVVAQSDAHKQLLYSSGAEHVTIWPMQYDEGLFSGTALLPVERREVDVFFPQRCSITNATHHVEFLEAMSGQPWQTWFADVTGFLKRTRPELHYSSPATYMATLCNSRVAVCLYDNGAASMTLREAVRAGCRVVCPYTPGFTEVLGGSHPWFTHMNAAALRATIQRALTATATPPVDVRRWSYQDGCRVAADEVTRL